MTQSQLPGEQVLSRRDYPILYVDDEADNRLVFRANLGDEFKVLTCSSGEEALALIETEDVALVLADQRMPGMSGIDLCEQIQRRHPQVRRLLITAYSDQRTAMEAINRGGVHGFLVKPWDGLELRQVLSSHLERVHLERTVTGLRTEIQDRERQLGLAMMHDRLLHDLGGVTFRLGLICSKIESAIASDAPGEAKLQTVGDGVAKMRRAVDHLVSLHSERRSVSFEQRPQLLDVNEVVETVKVLSGLEHLPSFRLEVSGPRAAKVFADRVSVTRILVNLVTNALEAYEAAGTSRGRLELSIEPRADGRVAITLSDDGPGISEEQRPRIFEERFSTKKQAGGSGIGLSSSRALADANGGTLELMPSTRGASFRLTLPDHEAAADEARPIAHPSLH